MYKFEKLKVWKESLILIELIYKLTKQLPKSELYNLSDQLRRSTVSISLNLAEGSGAENDKEFCRYIHIARKSLYETIAILQIIVHLYKLDLYNIEKQIDLVSKLLAGLLKYLKNNSLKSRDE